MIESLAKLQDIEPRLVAERQETENDMRNALITELSSILEKPIEVFQSMNTEELITLVTT